MQRIYLPHNRIELWLYLIWSKIQIMLLHLSVCSSSALSYSSWSCRSCCLAKLRRVLFLVFSLQPLKGSFKYSPGCLHLKPLKMVWALCRFMCTVFFQLLAACVWACHLDLFTFFQPSVNSPTGLPSIGNMWWTTFNE